MYIDFVVRKPIYLKKAEPIGKREGIAVTGRIKTVDFTDTQTTIVLNPVVVRYADRLSPVVGKEMLHGVDPDARSGTETEGGK